MGWTYYPRKEVPNLEAMIKRLAHDVVASHLANEDGATVLWTLVAATKDGETGHHLIVCDLIVNDGSPAYPWGHKTMSEDMGPLYYSVPLEWLERTKTEDWGGFSASWRAKILDPAIRHADTVEGAWG